MTDKDGGYFLRVRLYRHNIRDQQILQVIDEFSAPHGKKVGLKDWVIEALRFAIDNGITPGELPSESGNSKRTRNPKTASARTSSQNARSTPPAAEPTAKSVTDESGSAVGEQEKPKTADGRVDVEKVRKMKLPDLF